MANNRGGQTISGQPAVHLGNFDEMLRLVSGPGSGFDADTIHGLSPTDFVRSTTSITAGTGLSGGGTLDANRTLAILFAGTGAANTSARSDHNHTLDGLSNTVITSVADGEILVWDTTTSKWINQTLAEAGIQPAGSYLLATANAVSATKLLTARTISLAGDVTGSVSFDGTANVSITAVVVDDSHVHSTSTITGLDTALAGKSATTHTHTLASASISDVTITSNTAGEILMWNGTSWINQTLAEAGIQPAGSYLLASANAVSATKLATARTISLTGDVTGSVSFDGTGNAAISTTYKASGVGAGTYRSVTVDAKGNVTAGTNPTTVAGYGLTDVSPTTKLSATLPATTGWYRIATSPISIDRCAGRFEIDWAASGIHGQVNLQAAIMFGIDPTLNQIMFSTYALGSGITTARIVYHPTYASNYAYLEVYYSGSIALPITTQLASSLGWTLITPIAGSIPAGYTTSQIAFSDGIVTDTQLVSTVATGISPLKVTSTTPVANLAIGGNAGSATKWLTGRTITLTGDVTGTSAAWDGTGNISFTTAIADDSHNHTIANIDLLQTTLDAKALATHTHTLASASITDVTITSNTAGEILVWNGTSWINQTLAEAGIQPAGSYLGSASNAVSASKWLTGRTITLTGDVTGTSAAWDGAGNISFATAIADDSHNHTIANIDLLQATLDGKSLSTHTHTIAGTSITDVVISAPANDEVLAYDSVSAKWINQTLVEAGIQPAGSYLLTTGKAADSEKLDTLDSTQFLRSDVADSGTTLTLTGSLITDTITGRTTSYVINLGPMSVDGNGGTARWRSTNQVYMSQDSTGDVNFMGTDGGVSATKFRFIAETASPYHRVISFGNARIKALNGSLDQLQIRNSADTAYIPIVASAFTVSSRRDTKKNIAPYEGDALALINASQPSNYHLKSESDDEKLHLGLILEEAPTEVVDSSETGIDSYAMETLSWKAIQQLSAKEQEQAKLIVELSEKEQVQANRIIKLESQLELIINRLEVLEAS